MDPFVGEIRMFAGTFAPSGWALCNGQLLSITQNDALFSLVGTTYGGDGETTFGLPDLRGRLPVHSGSGAGLTPRSIGAKSGSETATVSNVSQLPSHSHQVQAAQGVGDSALPAARQLATTETEQPIYRDDAPDVEMSTLAIQNNTGGSQSHDNLMPFQVVNFIIALFGVYPSNF